MNVMKLKLTPEQIAFWEKYRPKFLARLDKAKLVKNAPRKYNAFRQAALETYQGDLSQTERNDYSLHVFQQIMSVKYVDIKKQKMALLESTLSPIPMFASPKQMVPGKQLCFF